MWPLTFQDRLVEWKSLRLRCDTQDESDALHAINHWWWMTPQVNHYLHWDDYCQWPGPWDLLSDNIYCDVARALGIMYTVIMIPQFKDYSVDLVLTDESNLVLVGNEKYILNYSPGDIVNIGFDVSQVKRRCNSAIFRHLIG